MSLQPHPIAQLLSPGPSSSVPCPPLSHPLTSIQQLLEQPPLPASQNHPNVLQAIILAMVAVKRALNYQLAMGLDCLRDVSRLDDASFSLVRAKEEVESFYAYTSDTALATFMEATTEGSHYQ